MLSEILKVRTALGEMPTQEQTPRFVDGRVGRVQACGDASTPKVDRRVLLQEKVFVPVHEYPDVIPLLLIYCNNFCCII